MCLGLQEGFSTKRPSSGHGRQSGGGASSGWASPQWRAVQANLTQQLKDSDASFENYRVSYAPYLHTVPIQQQAWRTMGMPAGLDVPL